MTYDEIVETFEMLDDWEDRYRYIVDLGRDLRPLDESEKTDDRLVPGCVSRVWLKTEVAGNDDHRLRFHADSDAMIVRGLIAILLTLYDERTPDEILSVDARAKLERLDLEGHLTPNRTNGLYSMVGRIQKEAAAHAA